MSIHEVEVTSLRRDLDIVETALRESQRCIEHWRQRAELAEEQIVQVRKVATRLRAGNGPVLLRSHISDQLWDVITKATPKGEKL